MNIQRRQVNQYFFSNITSGASQTFNLITPTLANSLVVFFATDPTATQVTQASYGVYPGTMLGYSINSYAQGGYWLVSSSISYVEINWANSISNGALDVWVVEYTNITQNEVSGFTPSNSSGSGNSISPVISYSLLVGASGSTTSSNTFTFTSGTSSLFNLISQGQTGVIFDGISTNTNTLDIGFTDTNNGNWYAEIFEFPITIPVVPNPPYNVQAQSGSSPGTILVSWGLNNPNDIAQVNWTVA